MSTPRTFQFIALRRLAAGGRQSRQLHMTGPATYPSPLLTAEHPMSSLPRDIGGLRAECKRRRISSSGNMHELMGRLSADDLSHSRAFSTAVNGGSSKRPMNKSQADDSNVVRHFNTSRTLKANNDSSTIDFAYLPDNTWDSESAEPDVRVPLLPTNFFPSRTGVHAPEAEEVPVLKPMVYSVSTEGADPRISTMAELQDNSAMSLDVFAIADHVAAVAKKNVAPMIEQSSILKELFNSVMEDLKGQPVKPGHA